jgi:hypothetical protein
VEKSAFTSRNIQVQCGSKAEPKRAALQAEKVRRDLPFIVPTAQESGAPHLAQNLGL